MFKITQASEPKDVIYVIVHKFIFVDSFYFLAMQFGVWRVLDSLKVNLFRRISFSTGMQIDVLDRCEFWRASVEYVLWFRCA